MKLATWNINSIRARTDRVIDVLNRHDLDILALQETKCRTEQFPAELFEQAGYHVCAHGDGQWNGVALISRYPITEVATQFSGQPGFTKGEAAPGEFLSGTVEPRALGATIRGVRVWSLYVPNGRSLLDPHYSYKIAWLNALHEAIDHEISANPDAQIALVGDWNVAPSDSDIWNHEAFDGLYVSPLERAAFEQFAELGMEEVTRARVTNYTFWDYQRLRFPRNEGMRIDFIWASSALAQRVTNAAIDREERKGKGASDHVPVIIEWANTDEN
ncbi:exodeoxyribonuclease III [Trueperella sp. LYQ143]|uniref:exodeoxyribonuclease III n=1 Tax=Trueperella sp. LYQ143 TaxID=3391059 RepID=UPI003982F013